MSLLRKNIIYRNRKKIVENVNGYTMHVDEEDTLALSWHRVFEPGTTEFFRNNIKPGQIVVDIGANIGYFTLLFSGFVGKEGHVYAFEPEPINASLLRKNLEVNSVKNVTVIERAVFDATGVQTLYFNETNRGNHQIFDTGQNRKTLSIHSVSLDEYFSDKKITIDWIKMDIEGAEFRALKGMRQLLMNNPEAVLVTEIFPPGLKDAGTSVDEYLNALKELKFEFQLIDEKRNKTSSVSAEELVGNFDLSNKIYPNVVCRRQ